MAQEKDNVWKWVSGILTAILLTGATAYVTFGSSSKEDIAHIQTDIVNLKDLQTVQTESLTTLTEILRKMSEENARIGARLDALEKRQDRYER